MTRPKRGEPVQREVIFRALPEAIAHSSGNGRYEFNQRGLFYSVRPTLIEVLGREPNYNTFCSILTDYEAQHGEIKLMYRDDRGLLYIPHRNEAIPLGTKSVRDFERPEWTFNKIIYIEKGSLISLLRQAEWPERHDCAVLTSQGVASRATRDLFDLLGGTDEALTFFCVHDADGYGTTIFESLVNETKARPARTVEVINLGLDPEEALAMGLPVEPVDPKRRVPAATYLAPRWQEWLQTKRVELNAMTSPQFMAWLDSKIAPHDDGKVIPPEPVLVGALGHAVTRIVAGQTDASVRAELEYDARVATEMQRRLASIPLDEVDVGRTVAAWLDEQPTELWSDVVEQIAVDLIATQAGAAS